MESKIKKCNLCGRRKKVSGMYQLEKIKESDIFEYWICSECNLEHDVNELNK